MPTLRATPSSDTLIRRLGPAAWRALPALGTLGIVSLLVTAAIAWAVGWNLTFAVLPATVLLSPVIMWAIDSLHEHMFDQPQRPRLTVRLVRVLVLTSLPIALLTWVLIVVPLAEVSIFFQLALYLGAAAAVATAAIATVAIPLGAVRGDVGLRALIIAAVLAVARRPLGAVAALTSTLAVAWCAGTWFLGLAVFIAPVWVVVSVVGAWTSAAAIGITTPRIATAHVADRITSPTTSLGGQS
ncbi:MAG TPA: hypothetical protein VL043_02760 [Protaetiibacter sp.]|nr:hypothetical protein [Protaetiibacter sp.]